MWTPFPVLFLLHHVAFQNTPVWTPLRHTLILATLHRMCVTRWTRVHLPHLLLSKGRISGSPPHAHSAPQLSKVQNHTLSACKGQFHREPLLIGLSFSSQKGKNMGCRGPWPLSLLRPRAQAGGIEQEPRLCSDKICSHTKVCAITHRALQGGPVRGGN